MTFSTRFFLKSYSTIFPLHLAMRATSVCYDDEFVCVTQCLTTTRSGCYTAQINLRDVFLEYKQLIGQVILDKNPGIRTVINKKDTLGAENEYRVLAYEIVAGEDDMLVETKETGCIFRFDYSKVFWNSRLNTEHHRLVDKHFKKGEIVCDVMAGVGPFAIPAAKKGVFVWANDLNPDCFTSLRDNITLNKARHIRQSQWPATNIHR